MAEVYSHPALFSPWLSDEGSDCLPRTPDLDVLPEDEQGREDPDLGCSSGRTGECALGGGRQGEVQPFRADLGRSELNVSTPPPFSGSREQVQVKEGKRRKRDARKEKEESTTKTSPPENS